MNEGAHSGEGMMALRAARATPSDPPTGAAMEDWVDLDELPTEIAIAYDGTLYVNASDADPARIIGRSHFHGWSMTFAEVMGVVATRPLLGCSGLVLASDGTVYGSAEHVPPETRPERRVFHGVEITQEERRIVVGEIHRIAFNVTFHLSDELGRRRDAIRREARRRTAAERRKRGARRGKKPKKRARSGPRA